jgi:hypothetical protein
VKCACRSVQRITFSTYDPIALSRAREATPDGGGTPPSV